MFAFEFDHFDWLSQLYSEWRQTSKLVNLKISANFRVCNFGKIWKWLKLLNSVPFIKERLVNHAYIRIWSCWTDFHGFTVNEDKVQNSPIFEISAKVWVCDFGQNFKMTKTS